MIWGFPNALNLLKNGGASHTLKKYFMKRSRYYIYQVTGPLTQARIVKTLRDLDLSTGDLVCVHSGFSSLGYVEGGPGTLNRSVGRGGWNLRDDHDADLFHG